MLRPFLLLVLSTAALAQDQPLPVGKGRIQGDVVDAATREPVKKAQVTLDGLPGPAAAVTDASGRFEFRDLPPGDYWLNAQKDGYNPPLHNISIDPNLHVALTASEEKTGVRLELDPTGSISGRILDEDGLPVHRCLVTAVTRESGHFGHPRGTAGSAATDDKGEYRIANLPRGRYFLFARYPEQLPAPHPLLPRGDARTPYETYAPQFYGGGLDPTTATQLHLTAGAHLEGFDFEMRRLPGLTLRGTISGLGTESAAHFSVSLVPSNRLLQNLMNSGAQVDLAARTFRIPCVAPGSYLLTVSNAQGHFYGEREVEIGSKPLEPVEVVVSAATDLKGAIRFDSDDHPALDGIELFLLPTEESPGGYVPESHAVVSSDGSFTFPAVLPGRWRLLVARRGYVKSLSLAGQQVSASDFQIPPGFAGPLHLTVGTKMADLNITVTGAPPGQQVSVLIYSTNPDLIGTRALTGAGQLAIGEIQPGRYRLLAISVPNPAPLLNKPDVIKSLESRTELVEVPEGGHVSVMVEPVSLEDLARALEQE